MAEYCHMENLSFEQIEKPSWADINAHLNIKCKDEIVGSIGLQLVLSEILFTANILKVTPTIENNTINNPYHKISVKFSFVVTGITSSMM